MKKFAKRLFTSVLAAAVACTTVIGNDMTALAAEKKAKATKIAGSTYTTADLIWEDNFDGDALNTKYWNYEAHEPGWVNAEWQSYPSQKENETTGNIYVKDGKLTIQAKKTKNADGTYSYTSGRVNTQNKVDTKYGRFEARIKMPSGKGFLPAFWMMPTDENLYGQWPKCGEIDITEVHGSQPDTAYSTLHFGEPHTQRQNTYTLKKSDFSKDFHVYACEWEPGEIRFYIDNKLFYTVNDWFTKKEGFDEVTYPAPFDQPYYIILNLAVGGSWVGYPDETTAFGDNAQMVVDYVKVYQKDSYNEKVKKPENTVKLRKPDKKGNYVANSNFAKAEKLNDGKNWEFMLAGTGDASAKISKNALHITTKNAGDLDYSVQVVQPNIPMEQGYQYKLSFDAYADAKRTMITAVTAPDNGYIRYFNDTKVDLTTKKKTYSYTFDMKSATDANSRVEFNLGNQGSTAGVHITNVKVVRVKKISTKEAKSVRPDGNYVYNGEFQEGADRLNYWTVKKAKGASVKVTNSNNVRQLKAVVPASVKKASDVTVKQTKVAIKGGKSYVLSFDAKRTGAKDQTLIVKIAGKTYKAKLTGSMKTYKFDLKPAKGTKNATLEFQLGTKGTTYIDNVRIMENGLIINGDFSAGLTGFEAWANNPSDVSYVVDTLKEDSAFSMDIKDTGDQDWHIQLKQTGVKLEKGQNYKISFKAKATTDRDIKFVFQRNGLKRKNADGSEDWTVYFSDEQIPVTTKWQTYSAVFEMTEDTDADTSMSFNFGAIGGKRITDKHTVLIDDIVLEKTDEKVEKDDSLIINGHFTKGLSPFETWAHDSAKMESGVDNDKVFYATISNTGSEDWHAQLKQVNIPLENGQTYTFSFRAKSDMDREIKYAFQKDGNKHNDDWTVYFEESNIPVTKEWKTYTTVFKMNNASDKEASFSFNLGAVGKQIKDKHTVMIDDVTLRVATAEEKKEVKNANAGGGGGGGGNGDSGQSQTQTTRPELAKSVSEWTVQNDTKASVEKNSTGVKVTIKDLSGSPGSVKQVIPTSISTTGVGNYDTFHFQTTMKSSVAKTVTVKAMKGTSTIKTVLTELLAGVSQTVTLDFTGEEINNAPAGVNLFSLRSTRLLGASEESETVTIVIEMGKHTTDVYTGENTGTDLPVIEIGNVSVKETSNKKEISVGSWYVYATEKDGNTDNGYIAKEDVAGGVQLTVKNISAASEGWRATYESKGLDWNSGYSLEAGIYEFAVTGKADKSWNMELMLGDPASDSKSYGDQRLTLGTTLTTHTATFTLKQPATVKLMIKLANIKDTDNRNENNGEAEIFLSKVKLTKVAPYVAPSVPEQEYNTNLLKNASLEGASDGNAPTSWEHVLNGGDPAPAVSASYVGNKAEFNITDIGKEEWGVQLKQTGITFEEGSLYKLTFKASSDKDRYIKAILLNKNEGQPISGKWEKIEYSLGSTETAYSVTIKSTVSTTDGCLQFSLGNMTGKETPASKLTISDISVMKVENDAGDDNFGVSGGNQEESPGAGEGSTLGDELIGNGAFSGNIDGTWKAGEKSPEIEWENFDGNGVLKATISGSPVNAWDTQVCMYAAEKLDNNSKYQLSFKIKGTSTYEIIYGVQKNSGDYSKYKEVTCNISNEWQTVSAEITTDGTADSAPAAIFFFIGKAAQNDVIYIDDISLKKVVEQ